MLNDLRDTFGYRIPELFPGGGKTPQGNAVIAGMPTTPNAARQKLIQALVKGLLDDGEWQTKDILYLTAAHAADSSLLNWINPGTHDLTVVNLVAGQFTIDRGWTGNGVNGYLNTNYNPNTDAINYALNDASAGVYIRTDVNESTIDLGSNKGTGERLTIVSRWTGNFYNRVNTNAAGSFANANSTGFYIVSRLEIASQHGYKNKVHVINDATNSLGLPDRNIYVLAENNVGVADVFSTKQIAEAHAGGGMTQTNVNNFDDRLVTFLTAIGAAV